MSRRAETRTGGRDATTRHIFGQFALSVGMPKVTPPPGWRWVALTDVARMESGHTPSRNHPEYWGGDVPWIGIRDAKAHHGETIHETIQATNELGIQNSSARILPEGTVCLSRTASVGYVVTMGRPMATSQDFANWICSDQIDRRFLVYLFLAEQDSLLRFASGAVHQTIYYPELKALHVCLPPLSEQQRTVAILDEAFAGLATAAANAEKNLKNARELFESYLNSVFTQARGGWKTSELGKEVKFIDYRGKTPPKRERGIRLITAKNVKMNRIQREPEEFIDANVYDGWMTRGYPKKGDVLFTTEAPLGNVAQLDTDETVVIGQRLITMQPDECVLDRTFLKYALMSRPIQAEIFRRGTGATVFGIKASLLKQVPILFPPQVSDQQALATEIESNANSVALLEDNYRKKIEQLAALKQSILQKAFSGELTSPPSQAIREAAE